MIPSLNGLLLRFPAGTSMALAASRSAPRLARAKFDLEPLFATHAAGLALAPVGKEWFVGRRQAATGDANPWDVAHEAHARLTSGAGLVAGVAPDLIEPDLLQQWPYETPAPGVGLAAAAAGNACVFEDQNPALPVRGV